MSFPIPYFSDTSGLVSHKKGRRRKKRGPQVSGNAALALFAAGASALIFAAPMGRQLFEVDLIPTIYIDISQGTKILYYIESQSSKSGKATVHISPSKTIIGGSPAPKVAYFSSRGPSSLSPNILKPDISAPGVNILAAWVPVVPPSSLPIDPRSVKWNFQSGTSMSCPHVSGIVALLKPAHPQWSPTAITSALVTTAYRRDTSLDKIVAGESMKAADPFDVGGGHVNPLKAMDPGLVYDMCTSDHIFFLCNISFTKTQITSMLLASSKTDISCPKYPRTNYDLNYPSISVPNLRSTTTIKRKL